MDLYEYHRLRDNYASSDAPTEVKEEAIRKLDEKFFGTSSTDKVRKDLLDSRPDDIDFD